MMRAVRTGGASLFEFVVCIILVGLLAGVLLVKLQDWREQSERAAARHVIGALRTALAARVAQLSMTGGEEAILALAQENPMDWLSRKPSNYIGEYYAPELASLPRGVWFFDRSDKTLVYLLGCDSFASGTPNLLKFKVELSQSSYPAGTRDAATLTIREVAAPAERR